ncbi:MAG: phosphoenolpyruvate carboxykinase, partial [Thermoplasmata archaeon]
MATVDVLSPRTIRAKGVLKNLSREELRDLARPGEKTTEYGSPVYSTRVKNRSASKTYVVASGAPIGVMQQAIERGRAEETIREVQEKLSEMELIQVDRRMGMNPEVPIHCRLYVPKEYARIAFMWHNMLFPSDSSKEPDFISVYVPDWKERLIFLDVDQGYTYILGSDYPGEAKKSMLRQAMYWIKRRGGLGLHAGSKVLRVVGPDGELRDVGFLLFGLSGTGKTTLTLHDHALQEPERAIIKQDDVVLMTPEGEAFGTEDGFYIKTEGLEPSQTVLWGAATHETAVYENIMVRENGKVDFLDTSITSNGRGVVLRKFIRGTGEGIDLDKANKIVFITRRNDVVPVCARLTAEQAAAYFM